MSLTRSRWLAVLADKAGTTLDVGGVAALNSGAMYLNTINSAVKTVRDFGENDRIPRDRWHVDEPTIRGVTPSSAAHSR
jgi:hypothetical protein